MNGRTDPWHVRHTVESVAGTNGYQINGPASFLIFGDEVDELIKLLYGIKVDDAIRQLSQLDVSVGVEMQGTIPGLEPMGYPVTDEIMPDPHPEAGPCGRPGCCVKHTAPHTRRYIPGDEV